MIGPVKEKFNVVVTSRFRWKAYVLNGPGSRILPGNCYKITGTRSGPIAIAV